MSIIKKIKDLESNITIKNNNDLNLKYVSLLDKSKDFEEITGTIYTIVSTIKSELDIKDSLYPFSISFDYKNSPTPELKLHYDNFFYNLINEEFSQTYYNIPYYESFLKFTKFMNQIDSKINCFFESLISISREICSTYHSLTSQLFKIENEEQINKYKYVGSFFKNAKMKREHIKDFIEIYKLNSFNISFKTIEFNNKKMKIHTYRETEIKEYFTSIIKNNGSNNDVDMAKIIDIISKKTVIYYTYPDGFSKTLGINYDIDTYSIEVDKLFDYLNMKANLKEF